MKVSICIPTCNRPYLLLEALNSCLEQSYKPFEIIIGDDSANTESKLAVEKIKEESKIPVRYIHNVPSLKQANNIQMMFNCVMGDKVVLLHDDDLLMPQALEIMGGCFNKFPGVKAVFGKQYIINEDGAIDYITSECLNKDYYRTKEFEGEVLTPLEACVVQQFPNDGYMMDISILKEAKYRTKHPFVGEIGNGCEFDFGIQIGLCGFKMIFVNEYLAKYRLSSINSISSSCTDDAAYRSFLILYHTEVPYTSKKIKDKALKNKMSIAIMEAARMGKRLDALKLYFSTWHLKRILTLGGIRRIIYIILRVDLLKLSTLTFNK